MFHLRIILRNLHRGGLYSAINIGGLAIGMAAAILIIAWIYHEWSYDRFHAKEKHLHVVYNRAIFDGELACWDWTPIPLGPSLKTDYPDIAGVARMKEGSFLFTCKETKLKMKTGYTDPDFLTMFDFPLLRGNRETALNEPNSVILTEKAVKRLFGEKEPMGELLQVNNKYTMMVTGVMKDLPGNTLFDFEALVPVDFMKVEGWDWRMDNWGNNTLKTFVELQPNVRLDLVNESIRNITNAHTNGTAETEVFLNPLGKQHLYYGFENGAPSGGKIETLRLFTVIAGLILLIACINFMNLSTARSAKRAKEVGVRKVLGSRRWSLIGQFMAESMTVSFIAGTIGLVIALVILPLFETWTGQQLTFYLKSVWFWVSGLGFVLLTGLLAGSYPSFFLSSFLPLKVLKGIFGGKQALVSSRKVLVIIQFTIACTLIMSTLVIHRQITYAKDRESGYDKNQLIYITMDGDISKNYELIKHDLLNSGTAISVTKTSAPMTLRQSNTWGVGWKGKEDPSEKIIFDLYFTDADWTKTVGATIIEGRDIDIHTYATDSTALLLNEAAVKIMNFENPIGEIVNTQKKDWHVVGVIKDFIIRSPYQSTDPMLIGGPGGWFNTIHIKLNSKNRTADNLAQTEKIFKTHNPAYPFEYKFVDEEYARKFKDVQKTGALITWFAGLTIFISCLGLFALVAYMAETRRKEIGIRKVLGASVCNITSMLSKEFLILVLISIAVASPIAWWAMEKWLGNYAYRTNIPWWLFVAVGCMCLCIASLTVGLQAIKAATANPVESIKN